MAGTAFRPRRNSRYAAACRRMSDGRKGRSAIITAITRLLMISRCFTSNHMWHRKDAIYPATIVGKPRQEDYYLGEFLQRLLSPGISDGDARGAETCGRMPRPASTRWQLRSCGKAIRAKRSARRSAFSEKDS